jgi:hypothetical protein
MEVIGAHLLRSVRGTEGHKTLHQAKGRPDRDSRPVPAEHKYEA